jgi:hypothetical protein
MKMQPKAESIANMIGFDGTYTISEQILVHIQFSSLDFGFWKLDR